MRRQLILCTILSLFGCGDGPNFGDDFMGPANWGAAFEHIDWVITLDGVSSSSNSFQDTIPITTLSNEYITLAYYIPLPAGEGLHSIQITGTCNVDYHDSTLYPDYILAEVRNIWFSKLDSTGYWKEYFRVVNGFGENFYEFKNPDTSFVYAGFGGSFKWDDFDANSLIKPFGLDQPFYSDSIGNYVLEVDLPAIIKGDTMSLFISPQPGLVDSLGDKLLFINGKTFKLIFQ